MPVGVGVHGRPHRPARTDARRRQAQQASNADTDQRWPRAQPAAPAEPRSRIRGTGVAATAITHEQCRGTPARGQGRLGGGSRGRGRLLAHRPASPASHPHLRQDAATRVVVAPSEEAKWVPNVSTRSTKGQPAAGPG